MMPFQISFISLDPPEFKWSPRMDVVESGRSYVATLELPGVNINSIKVEVNDQV